MALDTWDLQALMCGERHWVGVFPLDGMPAPATSHKVPIKMIVNLDPSSQPGSHWVALYRNGEGNGFYFDTFGQPLPTPISHWLSQHTNRWRGCLDGKAIQPTNDRVSCGYICMAFLKRLP
jgi:hypothetical protein